MESSGSEACVETSPRPARVQGSNDSKPQPAPTFVYEDVGHLPKTLRAESPYPRNIRSWPYINPCVSAFRPSRRERQAPICLHKMVYFLQEARTLNNTSLFQFLQVVLKATIWFIGGILCILWRSRSLWTLDATVWRQLVEICSTSTNNRVTIELDAYSLYPQISVHLALSFVNKKSVHLSFLCILK
jgi:hypothetical protein